MIITTAVAILPGIAQRLKIPSVVLEILFGLLIGGGLLGLEIGGHWLPFLAELGFLILMFLAGAEVDFGALKRESARGILLYLAVFGITLSLALTAAIIFGWSLFLGLSLATSSLAVVLSCLKDRGIVRTPLGQGILVSATLGDFLTFFSITLYILVVRYGATWRLLAPLAIFGFFGLMLWSIKQWVWWNPDKAALLLGRTEASELGVRFCLAVLFVLVGLSQLVGLEPVLGAFLGGALLSLIFRERRLLEEKISALAYGFLTPFFFINTGAEVDLKGLLHREALLAFVGLWFISLLVKLVPAQLLRIKGFGLREVVAAGVLLSARLSLLIAAATIGAKEGLISSKTRDALVLLALVSSSLSPAFFRRLLNRGRLQELVKGH